MHIKIVPWLHLVNDIDLCHSQKLPKKSINPLFWHSRSSKVTEFGSNQEPVYDFLLVINSNRGLISHRYWDTASNWPKIANFAHPLSLRALDQGDPLQIYGKALPFLQLVFQPADGKDLVTLACTVFDWSTRVTDRWTDEPTNGQKCDG